MTLVDLWADAVVLQYRLAPGIEALRAEIGEMHPDFAWRATRLISAAQRALVEAAYELEQVGDTEYRTEWAAAYEIHRSVMLDLERRQLAAVAALDVEACCAAMVAVWARVSARLGDAL